MKNINSKIKEELSKIEAEITDEPRLKELFLTLPNATIDVFNLTTEHYAIRQYDEINSQNKIIPHGFYGVLESSIRTIGVLNTLKKYKQEIDLIAKTMNIDFKYIISLIKDIKEPALENILEHNRRLKSQAELKEIIRKFTSKYKESYIKQIIIERKRSLEPHITYSKKTKIKMSLSEFINFFIQSKENIERLTTNISNSFGITVSLAQIIELIKASFTPNYMEVIEQVLNLNITRPQAIDYYKANKTCNRLKHNYETKLNKQLADCSQKEKEAVLDIIRYRIKAKKGIITDEEKSNFIKSKSSVHSANLTLVEEISTIMSECEDCSIRLENGMFIFEVPKVLTKAERAECVSYTHYLGNIKKIHNIIQKIYASENYLASQNQISYSIDLTPWFKYQKIKELLGQINKRNVKSLSDSEFTILKKLLLEKGLLWAYLVGNLETSTIAVIINNFHYIVNDCNFEKLTAEKLNEIIRKSYLYIYADDILVGLLGSENVAKIINYNQFVGVPITKDVIRKRLNCILDLAIRSELYPGSSLPYECEVNLGNYTLSRYQNNDPNIFVSGIDTKTCFFVSVNENDFFIYSLLSKDGFVIKITNNTTHELVARASCFRKNNVLMINGIRWKNNKVVPENQEESKEIDQIVDSIVLMAQKIISITTNTECPIDYVVCNRAGILEESRFEEQFEQLNPILFNEPINVYDEEWQRFIHLYDDAPEQFLQEVPYNPEHSFTTDFGDHYPALLLASRNNMGLVMPSDISRKDQPVYYKRPRRKVETKMRGEINQTILNHINRIRALYCFVGTPEEVKEKRASYRLITNIDNIESVTMGEDWVIINYTDGNKKVFFSNLDKPLLNEVGQYIIENNPSDEQDVKLYHTFDFPF